jgi:aspartate/methionine/tyrosine aminotransferase
MAEDYDFLFAKSKLPSGFVDLSIGENHLLRKAVIETYDLKSLDLSNLPNIFEYASPYGYDPLIEELEDIYPGKVVIGSGAKHLLSAAFYAMRVTGRNKIHIQKPWWSSIPSLISRENLQYSEFINGCDAQLIVAPNNPNGSFNNNPNGNFNLIGFGDDIPVIHDGAYYTHSYLSRDIYLNTVGDIQIFSVSKMYGLSGTRLGIGVCHNPIYYEHMTKFIEATTAGISTMSQAVLLHIVSQRYKKASDIIEYEDYVRHYLSNNRKYLLNHLNPKIFGVDSEDQKHQIGMFAWVKSETQDFTSVGVNVIGGVPFGDPSKIRINLAVEFKDIVKAVNRMNSIK